MTGCHAVRMTSIGEENYLHPGLLALWLAFNSCRFCVSADNPNNVVIARGSKAEFQEFQKLNLLVCSKKKHHSYRERQ